MHVEVSRPRWNVALREQLDARLTYARPRSIKTTLINIKALITVRLSLSVQEDITPGSLSAETAGQLFYPQISTTLSWNP